MMLLGNTPLGGVYLQLSIRMQPWMTLVQAWSKTLKDSSPPGAGMLTRPIVYLSLSHKMSL